MEQSQHVNIAARIQQLIVSRHINKQETKMQSESHAGTNKYTQTYPQGANRMQNKAPQGTARWTKDLLKKHYVGHIN